jgi:hypothetical protein
LIDGPFLETEGVPMGNRRYTLELKIKFLDTFEKMGSVAKAARALGILNDEVCYSWVRKKEELRAGYKLSLKPCEPPPQVKRDRSKVSLEEKVRCMMAIEAGLSIHRTSLKFHHPGKKKRSYKD